ncbi:nodulation protein NfeD [Bacillus sp. Marseille-Q3570]|uniref:NfeD family protein n=1 Tax=Bacillus sp. Marseille-Q3570 TaxID=2963522 RepID=UPI0021B80248|nr:nodulation protein NfeD [Bacillus sp. Marseille-Q3570]
MKLLTRNMKITFYMLLILLPMILVQINPSQAEDGKPVVYVAPVQDAVERGLESFIKRSIKTAEDNNADYLVLELDTPGGLVDAAGNIAKIMRESEVPIVAYVTKHALSAGAYIALNADQIVMKPSTTMGSAGVIDSQGNAAGKKAESAWIATMEASAELNDRDPKYARAMADPDVEIEELGVSKGEFLTLNATQAKEVGYAEAIVSNRNELLSYLEVPDAEIKEIEVSFAETIARYVTHPVVVPILLSIGSIGLVLELYSPGFGIPGAFGLGALLLFFFGHMIAGLAGWESLILFVLGIGLIIAEVFVPGGILGVGGIIAVLVGIVLAGGSLGNILLSILIALVATIIVSILFLRYFGYNGPLKKIILFDSTSNDKGYISNITKSELIGMTGTTMTPLRPSGTAIIGEDRYDVVTEGSYIGINRPIKIIKTEGSRIIVREIVEVENQGGN